MQRIFTSVHQFCFGCELPTQFCNGMYGRQCEWACGDGHQQLVSQARGHYGLQTTTPHHTCKTQLSGLAAYVSSRMEGSRNSRSW